MPLTLDKIEVLAPEHFPLAGLRQLLKPAGCPALADADGLACGECQGKGRDSLPRCRLRCRRRWRLQMHLPEPQVSLQALASADLDARRREVAFTPAPFPEWVMAPDRGSHLPPAMPSLGSGGKPEPSRLLTDIVARSPFRQGQTISTSG